MNNQTLIILGIVVAIVVSVSSGVFYVVREDEQVVITQFGKPIGQTETTAGLKLKFHLFKRSTDLISEF